MKAADNVLFTVWIDFVFIATFGNKFNVRHFQTEETSRGDPKIHFIYNVH